MLCATALPGNRFEFEAELAVGDEVVSRWTLRGTHRGPFMGIQPTGRGVAFRGSTFFRLAEAVIVEVQRYADMEGLSAGSCGHIGLVDSVGCDARAQRSLELERRPSGAHPADGVLTSFPVSPAVGDKRNNWPALIEVVGPI